MIIQTEEYRIASREFSNFREGCRVQFMKGGRVDSKVREVSNSKVTFSDNRDLDVNIMHMKPIHKMN